MKPNQLLISATRSHDRSGFDLTLTAPLSMCVVFSAADSEQRKQILTAWREVVNEALHEVQMILGETRLPVDQRTHHHARSGQTFLHTHCVVGFGDASRRLKFWQWLADQRRAFYAFYA